LIDSKTLLVWGGGIGAGKLVDWVSAYLDMTVPGLTNYYFKELVGLLGGPAAVGIAWKMSRGRHQAEADAIGLAGVEMFVNRVFKMAEQATGVVERPVTAPRGMFAPRAPPPGQGIQHWPYTTQQRLPFQSDLTW
jgi:hypothetical protein